MGETENLFPPSSKERLETPARYRELKPKELLAGLGLKPGDRVVDLGAGTGFFAIAAASIVGRDGAVWAVDLQPEMVEELKQRSLEEGYSNIRVIKADVLQTGLEDGAATAAVVSFVIHEVQDKVAFLKEAHRIVGPGGRVFVIDFLRRHHPDPDYDHGPPFEIRIEPSDLALIAKEAGLRVTKVVEVSPITYAAVVEE